MYRFLLLLLIPFFACNQDPPQIIDLRPPESSFEGEYVELEWIDTIESWNNLQNALCEKYELGDRAFLRISMDENTLEDSNYQGAQLLLAPSFLCPMLYTYKIKPVPVSISMRRDSLFLHSATKHIGEKSLPYILYSYYFLSEYFYYREMRAEYHDFRIAAKLNIDDSISLVIKLIKIIVNAHLELKSDFPNLTPKLNLEMRTIAPPPPPLDSLRKWYGE